MLVFFTIKDFISDQFEETRILAPKYFADVIDTIAVYIL